MKGKILPFIIGILVGAIIATTGFLIYSKSTASNFKKNEMMQMKGNGQMGGQQGDMNEPPEKPDGNNGEQPPAKPEEDTNNNTIK